MDPAPEYARRAEALRLQAARLDRRSAWLGNLKLAVALAAIVGAGFYVKHHAFSGYWLLVPVIVFAVLVVVHDRVIAAQQRTLKAEQVYRRGLARIEDRWAGLGADGERFRPQDHVFADDLDLFGRGSLFELLSTARSGIGEQTLSNWLLAPAAVAEVLERQRAVQELRDKLDLREDLGTIGEDLKTPRDPQELIRWAEAPPQLRKPLVRVAAAVLAAAAVAATAYGGISGLWYPLAAIIAVEAAIAYGLRARVHEVLDKVSGASAELSLVSVLLARLEQERFDAPYLQALSAGLEGTHELPSRSLAGLRWLADLADGRHNMVVRLLDLPLLYSVQVAFAAEAWRRRRGGSLRRWLEALGAAEALVSLAAYAYEHPGDPFPEFLPQRVPPVFMGEDMGHPLLPAAQCVRNSVSLGDPMQVLLVSGSNMSGKSTLLRVVGINVVLAQAGAPVRARRLRMSPLRLGTCIRVTDSLQAGKSGFYAEITRLRRIMDLTGTGEGLLFLFDELLHGTNSHDRRIGAEGLIRALLERGAAGVVTTHDLALTAIGGAAMDGRVQNAHFQDFVEEGRMRFDYKLRGGVVTKSNALELMRSIGLDV